MKWKNFNCHRSTNLISHSSFSSEGRSIQARGIRSRSHTTRIWIFLFDSSTKNSLETTRGRPRGNVLRFYNLRKEKCVTRETTFYPRRRCVNICSIQFSSLSMRTESVDSKLHDPKRSVINRDHLDFRKKESLLECRHAFLYP